MRAHIILRYSLAQALVSSGHSGYDPKELALILLSLPPDSNIVGFSETKVESLYYETKVFVENPIFQTDVEIEIDYVRMAGVDIQKDKLVQFNNFKGLNIGPAINIRGKIDNH